ncbi:MAG: helix-turn-helix transcriptional regulator [Alphaproteobacteria bacterium]|nr:helix-turn-helix transcriptional regulator [Alphaproteobacteria bacterium]
MLSIEQIRAARALLDWSQQDLAEHADLSQTGIARIENGTNKPNSTTLHKIETAFDRADIEFIGTTGVKKRTGEIRTLNGQEGFRAFMDDVYKTTIATGADICQFNGVPSEFYKWLGKEWYENHIERMGKIERDFSFKIIVKEGENLFIATGLAEYRWFPPSLFNEKTFYAYGNKLAFIDFTEDDVAIRIMEQEEFANSFRILFNIAWEDRAQIPKNSNAQDAKTA